MVLMSTRITVFTRVYCASVYNAHPYFELHFERKKKRKQKTEEVVTNE